MGHDGGLNLSRRRKRERNRRSVLPGRERRPLLLFRCRSVLTAALSIEFFCLRNQPHAVEAGVGVARETSVGVLGDRVAGASDGAVTNVNKGKRPGQTDSASLFSRRINQGSVVLRTLLLLVFCSARLSMSNTSGASDGSESNSRTPPALGDPLVMIVSFTLRK
jgi:hypothetical protein